jgi:uncharacterized membrane protein
MRVNGASLEPELRWKTRTFAALVVLSNTLGNFSLAWGMKHRGESLTLSPLSYLEALVSPWVAAGVMLLILWMLARMTLLSWADLSYVLPVTSLGYVLNALMGRLLLEEHISPERWMGTGLIVAGTVLVGRGRVQTAGVPG